MQKVYWLPDAVVLATCTPFAVYVVPSGTEAKLEVKLATADIVDSVITFSTHPVTGDLIVSKASTLVPSPNLSPSPSLYPSNGTATITVSR